jgi:hypothetical protein
MSWSAAEYLHLVLVLNQTRLPREAQFLIRHQRFAAITKHQSCYAPLTSGEDKALLPLLAEFQDIIVNKQRSLEGVLQGEEFHTYYTNLMLKYRVAGVLLW